MQAQMIQMQQQTMVTISRVPVSHNKPLDNPLEEDADKVTNKGSINLYTCAETSQVQEAPTAALFAPPPGKMRADTARETQGTDKLTNNPNKENADNNRIPSAIYPRKSPASPQKSPHTALSPSKSSKEANRIEKTKTTPTRLCAGAAFKVQQQSAVVEASAVVAASTAVSPDNNVVRTEHKVVRNTKPLSKPLMMAARVTLVHTSPPSGSHDELRTEDALSPHARLQSSNRNENTLSPRDRAQSYKDRDWSESANDDKAEDAPKVSRLKAMFESADAKSTTTAKTPEANTQSGRCASGGADAASGVRALWACTSPRPKNAAPLVAVAEPPSSATKTDVKDAERFDSSTALVGESLSFSLSLSVSFSLSLSLSLTQTHTNTHTHTHTHTSTFICSGRGALIVSDENRCERVRLLDCPHW